MEKCVLCLRNCLSECGIDNVFIGRSKMAFLVWNLVYITLVKHKNKHRKSAVIFKLISTIEELSDF